MCRCLAAFRLRLNADSRRTEVEPNAFEMASGDNSSQHALALVDGNSNSEASAPAVSTAKVEFHSPPNNGSAGVPQYYDGS